MKRSPAGGSRPIPAGKKVPSLDAAAKAPLILWAVACAERVLPLFEKARPADDRPRRALMTARAWVRGGIKLAEIRAASLAAHAAARQVESPAARAAARAAGQAVAVAHSVRHSGGAAWYAIKAVEDPAKERTWQQRRLPKGLNPAQRAAVGYAESKISPRR
jgi:hypothetical protein